MPAQRQIDQIEREIVEALAAKRLPNFSYPIQPDEAIVLWKAFVRQITVSHEAFIDRLGPRITNASSEQLRLQRDDTPPLRFRGMDGFYFKLVDQAGATVFQFFFGEYSPMFRGYSR